MILIEADTQPADKNIKDDDKVDRPQLVGIAGNYGLFTKPSLDTSQTGKQGAWGVTVNQTFATRSNSSPPLKKSPFAAATEALEADVDKHDKGKANGLDARAKQRGDASDLDTSAVINVLKCHKTKLNGEARLTHSSRRFCTRLPTH